MREKRGQVTIFIILGVIIVVFGILVYMFYPSIKSTVSSDSQNPSAFMEDCLEKEIKNNLEILSAQGGSLNPEQYILYYNQRVEYLCYTNEYYKTCVVQQPMLKTHIESEIKTSINDEAKQCLNELKESYSKKGYKINSQEKDFEVELLPKRIIVRFKDIITIGKENSESYNSIEAVFTNNLYELTSIANSILNWESNYGDAETTTYMNYYKDLKVEKKKQSDGSKVYILTDRNSGNKFQFASRSVAWPPGYGTEE